MTREEFVIALLNGQKEFSNLVFRDENFSDMNFSNINFKECTFIRCNFKHSVFERANLTKAFLSYSNFSQCLLQDTVFDKAVMYSVNLDGALCTRASLKETMLYPMANIGAPSNLDTSQIISEFRGNKAKTRAPYPFKSDDSE